MNEITPIRIGIWGVGRAGWGMHCAELDALPEFFQVVAACDPDPERLEAFARRYPGSHTYGDGDAFLADGTVEVVAIAVRSQEHVAYTLRALEAGKIVFLEKPIALSSDEVERLAGYEGRLFFRHNRRFEACFNHVREIIDSGALGEVYQIKLCRHNFQLRDDWQTRTDCGGGQLNNWGPHLVDHALQLMGAPVADIWSDLKRIAAKGDAEDHVKVLLRGANGRVIDIEISGGVLIPGPVYSVYGSRGSLVSEDEREIKLKYLDPAQDMPSGTASAGTPPWDGGYGTLEGLRWIEKTIPVAPANGARIDDIYMRLYRSIREGRPFPVTAEQAFDVVRTIEKIKKRCEGKG